MSAGKQAATGRSKLGVVATGIAAAAMAMALVTTPGCGGDEATGPKPGTLQLILGSPHADDAAVVITVRGPGIETVEAADVEAYLREVEHSAARTVVLVAETLTPGVILRISVPDIGVLDDYSATLVQVADTRNALRGSLDGYTLTVAEPTR